MTETYLVVRGESGTWPVRAESPDQAVAIMTKSRGEGWVCVGIQAPPAPYPVYRMTDDDSAARRRAPGYRAFQHEED